VIGEEMDPPPGLAVRTVPIVDPTPGFPSWALWTDRQTGAASGC
jgi:hypothetical protein